MNKQTKESRREKQRIYRLVHSKQRIAYGKDYYRKNREKEIKRVMLWVHNNKHTDHRKQLKKQCDLTYRTNHSNEVAVSTKKWKKSNPDLVRVIRKRHTLKTKYNITLEQYYQMLKNQDNKCAICNIILVKPYIDHDHKTNKVRELLCCHCNSILGYCKENILILTNTIKYLIKHKE